MSLASSGRVVTSAVPSPSSLADELDAILAARAVFPRFQPIVDLASREPVAFEALARGPEESPLHRPDRLFETARLGGRVAELDRLCRLRAVEMMATSQVRVPDTLFVNREPAAVNGNALSAAALRRVRGAGFRIVVELTERALTDDPATLLAFADQVRAAGMGLAIDDVGAEAESLALMPFLRPDVVKLDLRLIQDPLTADGAQVVAAVSAYVQESGAVVLAEGIETEEHERTALGLGATFGQGWLYGHPRLLPASPTPTAPRGPGAGAAPPRRLRLGATGARPTVTSPYEAVVAQNRPQRATKAVLLALREALEQHAVQMDHHAVVLTTCMEAPDVSPECARHYTALAASAAYTAAVGATMPEELVPGLRGARIRADDPVSREWDLVVVGPHFAGAMVSRLRDEQPEHGELELDYALTYDRTLVLDAARSLMRRALPLQPPTEVTDVVGVTATPQVEPVPAGL